MHPYPHHTPSRPRPSRTAHVRVAAAGLPTLDTAPPAEFDGPGDRWSPETLLCAAVADCFLLSFRAVARASKFDWSALECSVHGKLDRVDGRTQFTEIDVERDPARPGGHRPGARDPALEKSEHVCLISNSLVAQRRLHPDGHRRLSRWTAA